MRGWPARPAIRARKHGFADVPLRASRATNGHFEGAPMGRWPPTTCSDANAVSDDEPGFSGISTQLRTRHGPKDASCSSIFRPQVAMRALALCPYQPRPMAATVVTPISNVIMPCLSDARIIQRFQELQAQKPIGARGTTLDLLSADDRMLHEHGLMARDSFCAV